MSDNASQSFNLRSVTFQEVLNELKSLRSDCSTGLDQIPVKYVKLAAEWITSPLAHIINHCIANNSFPKSWKLARVSPIPKTDHLITQLNQMILDPLQFYQPYQKFMNVLFLIN